MKTITIEQDDQGVITVSIDGSEPMPIDDADTAAEMVAQELGGGMEEAEGMEDEDDGGEMPMTEEAFAGGFNAVRQGGLNGGR